MCVIAYEHTLAAEDAIREGFRVTMKRRLEKAIKLRMARTGESYQIAKLIVLEQERKSKMKFRTSVADEWYDSQQEHG